MSRDTRDLIMYAICGVLITAALYIDGNKEVYGMLNLMVGAALREIGSR